MKKLFNSSQLLLKTYFLGNLVVLGLSTIIISLVLSWSTISQERSRSKISKQQLQAFLSNRKKQLSEDMWTGSHDAIGMSIASVVNQFGGKNFELQLVDPSGNCVYSVNQDLNPGPVCSVPEYFSKVTILDETVTSESGNNSRYLFIGKLSVGEFDKGRMYLSVDDPYHFYNGSIWGPAFTMFLPNMILLTVLLFAWFLFSNKLFFRPYLEKLLSLERTNVFHQVATQLAHDIRSPLAALEMISSSISELPEDKRIIIRNSINRIRDLANSLLSNKSNPHLIAKTDDTLSSELTSDSEESEVALLDPIIDLIVTEKRMQYRDKLEVEIEYRKTTSSYGLFSRIKPNQLKRVLSNLINNSVESLIDSKGRVEISLQTSSISSDTILIFVNDSGKGIPSEQIKLLGNRGYSYNKPNGSGLGLNHAFATIKSFGGDINIDSSVDTGTVVTVKLKKHQQPGWFVPKIIVKPKSSVVILDDDHSIHQVWKKRFERFDSSEFNLNLFHFTDPKEFQNFYGKQFDELDEVLFLMDYEITNSKITGLDLIEQLGIGNQSILVTSHYENRDIRDRCLTLGVRLIPKSMSGFIPVEPSFKTNLNVRTAELVTSLSFK